MRAVAEPGILTRGKRATARRTKPSPLSYRAGAEADCPRRGGRWQPMYDADMAPEDAEFTYYTQQYSQAVQALETIRLQAAKFIALGSRDDLERFLEQFIEMASRTAADANEKDLGRYAEWFMELVHKAEAMQAAVRQH